MLTTNAWNEFIEKGSLVPDIPPLIGNSWRRSKESKVNPFLERVQSTVSPQVLSNYQKSNPVYLNLTDDIKAQINSLLKQLKATISLTNSDGLILFVDGDETGVVEHGYKNGYMPGAFWTETSAGTTSTGICLRLKKPVFLQGHEHYCSLFHRYDAVSYPVYSPTKELAGVITITCETGQVPAIKTITWMISSILERVINEAVLNNHLSWQKYFSEYLFSKFPQAGLLVDADDRVILANSRAKACLGTTPVNLSELENHWHHKIKLNGDNKLLRFRVTKDEEVTISSSSLDGKKIVWFEKKSVAEKPLKNNTRHNFSNLIGKSKSLNDAIILAEKVAASDVNVLLEGETGTGKDMFSQAIHRASNRNSKPFIAVNCGAIPKELVVSELFGYEEGTFTGAKKHGNAGKFELANGGTILLDEIGELPSDVQVTLLRVLQNREIVRLGGHKVIPIDVRVIAATNRDLLAEVRQGRFRMDLYYRLNVVKIKLPPLRERQEDIMTLWEQFLKESCYRLKKEVPETSMAVQKILLKYSWLGNIRELQNAAERSAVLVDGCILPEHLPFEMAQKLNAPNTVTSLRVLERESILNALTMNNGNKTLAAQMLGLSRQTLYRKLREYKLQVFS